MAKQIVHGEESRQAILRGVNHGRCGKGDSRAKSPQPCH
jgi:hypothetical protein